MIKTGTPLIFPFLLGRAFIEAEMAEDADFLSSNFPSFWEGLSLRPKVGANSFFDSEISLPFGKGFH